MKKILALVVLLTFSISFSVQAQIVINGISTTPETCPGACDGTLTVNVVNATGAVSYSIGGAPQASNVFTNLCAANYTVLATDAFSSTATSTATITSPQAVISTYNLISPVSCFGNCDALKSRFFRFFIH